MKNFIKVFIAVQAIGLASMATSVDLLVNEQSLSCTGGRLTIAAPEISYLVTGNYPKFEFKVTNLDQPCFFKIYLIGKATESGGHLRSEIEVSKTTVQEPIFKCPPKPCSFCDPGECQVVGHRNSTEETVYLDILGLRFSAKSKINNP